MKNKVQMGVLKLFPTLVYQIDAEELLKPCLKLLNKVEWKNNTTNDATADKWVLKQHKSIAGQFNAKVNLCLETLTYVVPMKMTTSWWTRTPPNDSITKHKHSNCLWSAVYYVHDYTSPIVFQKADEPLIDVEFKCNDPAYVPYGCAEIIIKKGTMLVFPSYLYHWTKPNTTDKYRYSLAMNFMPHGKVYNGDSSYEYQ